MNSLNRDKWEKEDWKKAPGIKCGIHETNSGLATRDYSVPCNCPSENKIAVVNGFWIWWCSAHYQPLSWCEKGRLEERISTIREEAKASERKRCLEALPEIEEFANCEDDANFNYGWNSYRNQAISAISNKK